MNADRVTAIAQANPVPTLTKRWGETVHETRRQVAQLEASLGELAKIKDTLAEHDLTVAVSLGPVGDAAAAAHADMSRQKPPGFHLPTERNVA